VSVIRHVGDVALKDPILPPSLLGSNPFLESSEQTLTNRSNKIGVAMVSHGFSYTGFKWSYKMVMNH
jgi:hypothetical protein